MRQAATVGGTRPPETNVSAAPGGRKDAFREEALPHLDALYGMGLRLTGGDEAGAQDLVQTTMLRAFRSWDSYENGTDCRAWLMAILRNAYFSGHRKRQRRPRRAPYDEVAERSVEPEVRGRTPEEAFFLERLDGRITAAIEDLPERFRTPLILCDLQDLSYHEIADELEIPVGTVRSRLHRARRRVKRTLLERAPDLAPSS